LTVNDQQRRKKQKVRHPIGVPDLVGDGRSTCTPDTGTVTDERITSAPKPSPLLQRKRAS
jgi:hypothetical protein